MSAEIAGDRYRTPSLALRLLVHLVLAFLGVFSLAGRRASRPPVPPTPAPGKPRFGSGANGNRPDSDGAPVVSGPPPQ